jgi:biopolymer transport protein TolR
VKLPNRSEPLAGINVTPLVDVFLVLLVIFMITAPVLKSALEVALPQAALGEGRLDTGVTIELQVDGSVRLNGEGLVMNELLPRLFDERKKDSLATDFIFVAADGRVPYSEVIQLLDHLNEGGFRDVGLMTDPPSKGPK